MEERIPPTPEGCTLIPGVTGYAVNKSGELWSCRKPSRTRNSRFKAWRRIHATKNKSTGYWVVTLVGDDGVRCQHRLHCLVLRAFTGSPEEGEVGRHWDDDKDNNALDNLRWGTHQDNKDDAVRNGKSRGANPGVKHHKSRLKDDEVREIRLRRSEGKETYECIASHYGVAMTLVWKICNGKNWQHIT